MKKLISIALLLALCLSLFAGCQPEAPTTQSTAPVNQLKNAATFILNMYRDADIPKGEPMKAVKDFEVITTYLDYQVAWTVEVTAGPADAVKVVEGSKEGFSKIDVTERPEEEVKFTLTATIQDADGNKENAKLNYYTPAVASSGPSTTVATIVEAPVAGTAYKWGMLQGNLGAELFFAGTVANKDYYLATTEDMAASVDVTLEEVEGGYRMFFMADGVKTYIDIYQSGDYVNARLTTEPTAVFTWNAEYKTLTAMIGEEAYYIGTYKEYNTLSASAISHAATSFPSNLYTLEQKEVETTIVETPAVGTAYKWGMLQGNLGVELFFAGTVANKDYYLATTEDMAASVDVTLEEVEGGYRMFFMADGVKTYIDIYQNGDYVNARLTTEPTAVFTWNAEYKTLTAMIGEVPYYLGTYKEYNTLSASKLELAAGSFPSNLYIMGEGQPNQPAEPEQPNEPENNADYVTTPEIGKAYKLGMLQTNKDAIYYFTGKMSGYYGATETDKALAVDVYLEDAGDGNYHLYFMDGDAKKYIAGEASGTHLNFVFGDTKGVFTWNTDYATLTTTIGETVVFMGTYSNYVTFGMSDISKIDTSYAGHLYN